MGYLKQIGVTHVLNTAEKHVQVRAWPSTGLPDFTLVEHTKTGKIYQTTTKFTNLPQNIPNGNQIDQMAIKYANIFHYKTLQNLPGLGFLVRKYATLVWYHKCLGANGS
jgi:hypothetical protein